MFPNLFFRYQNWQKVKSENTIENFRQELADAKRKTEQNLDFDYWRNKFLYPYSLDTAPLKYAENQGPSTNNSEKANMNVLEST